MDGMEELKQTFFTECAELLTDMEDRLMKIDENTQDKEQLNAIFRCAHSIKGGAGAFGMDAIMHFTHKMEALLDEVRDGKVSATREVIDTLLKSRDIVVQMIEAAKEGREQPADFGADIVARLQHHLQGRTGAPPVSFSAVAVSSTPQKNRYQILFKPHEEMFLSGNEPSHLLRELTKLGEAKIVPDISRIPMVDELIPNQCFLGWEITLDTAADEETVNSVFEFVQHISDIKVEKLKVAATPPSSKAEAHAPATTKAPEEGAKTGAAKTTSIRVDLDKVDRLVNMVGELVITEAMLRVQARSLNFEEGSGLQRGLDELSQHTRELQEAVMSVRMQPVKSIFSRMSRIVRDTSAQLGKDIRLITSGENTEVDKTIIEQLGDPLTHMIRNSCDHGIETPDQRVWNDKPEQGTILLSAYQRSGRIIIDIEDDGAGINRQRVLDKAREKGLVAADAMLADEEIDHLIFLPGFSTAEQVTSLSGRGVGMDVVKRNIETLGGTVRIINRPAKGSLFTVSLPLTLAILDGMIVRVGAENYIIPITSIMETMRSRAEDIKKVEGHGDVINVRGEFVPLIYLHRIFQISGAEVDLSKVLIVMAESGRGKIGLVVDELVGQQQVVIKSLEANSDPVKGISGATILGDGRVSLILELNELPQLCQPPKPSLSLAKAA